MFTLSTADPLTRTIDDDDDDFDDDDNDDAHALAAAVAVENAVVAIGAINVGLTIVFQQ